MKTLIRVLAVVFALPLAAQSTETDAIARMRALYDHLDEREMVLEGRDLIDRYPSSTELRAWYIAALAPIDSIKALEMAKVLRYAHPKDPWSWCALAIAQAQSETEDYLAADTSRQMLALAPGDPQFAKMYAKILYLRDMTDEQEKFLAGRTEPWAVSAHAVLLDTRSWSDASLVDTAQEALTAAEKNDPDNAELFYLHADRLARRRRAPESYPLFQRALQLAPDSLRVHSAYWRALGHAHEAEAVADIDAYVKRRPYPEVLNRAREAFNALGLNERAEEMRRRIYTEFPHSPEAETILYSDASDYGREHQRPTPEQSAELVRRWRVFLDYPHHEGDLWLGGAYQEMYFALLKNGSDEDFLQAVDGWLAFDQPARTYVIAEGLATRGLRLDQAERVARNGGKAKRALLQRDARYYSAEDFAKAKKYVDSQTSATLGWVLLKRKKIEEAGRQLHAAVKAYPDNPSARHHLGQWYEATRQWAKAEESYSRGMSTERTGESLNLDALRALYVKRHGSEEGWVSYLAAAREGNASKKKREVLASRIVPARAIRSPFVLETLSGDKIALDSLKGKVAVIKFWGTWCAPCVSEMPEFQKLVDKYADDPHVAIVTIDSDQDPESPRKFMKTYKYRFPVLLDDGWINRSAGVNAYPTTWFVGADGRVAFEKKGMSSDLINEFTWRIEALR